MKLGCGSRKRAPRIGDVRAIDDKMQEIYMIIGTVKRSDGIKKFVVRMISLDLSLGTAVEPYHEWGHWTCKNDILIASGR